MATIAQRIEALGGAITTAELRRFGCDRDIVQGMVACGTIVRARRGWYVPRGAADDVIAAIRVGGRLACVSALAHHGFAASAPSALHVEVPANASRLRLGLRPVVLHWVGDPRDGSRRNGSQRDGDRRACSIPTALGQATRCRGDSLNP